MPCIGFGRDADTMARSKRQLAACTIVTYVSIQCVLPASQGSYQSNVSHSCEQIPDIARVTCMRGEKTFQIMPVRKKKGKAAAANICDNSSPST